MTTLIGIDEAGYGPNLGPLVVTVTVWEIPGEYDEWTLWRSLESIITQNHDADDSRLHIADSKTVYSPIKGISELEWSVLTALLTLDFRPASFGQLCEAFGVGSLSEAAPWYAGDLPIPLGERAQDGNAMATLWCDLAEMSGIRLRAVQADLVPAMRFNQLLDQFESKGQLLSQVSLRLLSRVWQPDQRESALIILDKHGGRNRYAPVLSDVFEGRLARCLREERAQSVYRLGGGEIRFQSKAERHLPVALASMVSKYLRELAMTQFNRYWQSRVENLKPTKGYPLDARRFRADIAEFQAGLNIDDDILWRRK